jgi:cytochrome c oxidase subunit 2
MDLKNADFTTIFNVATSQNKYLCDLHWFTLAICVLIGFVVTGLLIAVIVKFRTPANDDGSEPKQVHGNIKLEIIWTAIPLLIVTVLGVLTAYVMFVTNPPAANKQPDVVVIGHQWWWEYRYPKLGVTTANELVLPVGQNQLLDIEAADVVHSWWVPAFGQKMDAIPGHPAKMWLNPTKTGLFLGTCSEFCGQQHSLMRIIAKVVTPQEFDAWVKAQQAIPEGPSDASAERGKQLFESATCVQCHRVAGTDAVAQIGPDLTHIAQRQTLGAGVLENNVDNLAKWMQNPQTFKPGVYMPNMRLTDEEAHDIATYLENLK